MHIKTSGRCICHNWKGLTSIQNRYSISIPTLKLKHKNNPSELSFSLSTITESTVCINSERDWLQTIIADHNSKGCSFSFFMNLICPNFLLFLPVKFPFSSYFLNITLRTTLFSLYLLHLSYFYSHLNSLLILRFCTTQWQMASRMTLLLINSLDLV